MPTTKPAPGNFSPGPPVQPTPSQFNRAGNQLDRMTGQARGDVSTSNNMTLQRTQPYGAVSPSFQELQCRRMEAELEGMLPREGPPCVTGFPVHGPTHYDPHQYRLPTK